LILAIADQPLIFEGSEIAYDAALASCPEAIVASVARTAWSAWWRGSGLISGSTANNSSGFAERSAFFFVRPQTPCQIHTSRAKT
jgi:hypothetical protein